MDAAATIQHATQLLAEGRPDDAEAACRALLQSNPGQADALHLLGLVERSRGRHVEAIGLFNDAIRLQPNAYAHHAALGEALQARGELDQAAVAVFRALTLKPDSPQLCTQLATVLAHLGQTSDRPDALQKIVE